jgi:hypothetical protein
VLETSGAPGGDTRMWLYLDPTVTHIAYDDDGGDDYYSRIATNLPAGTYYVKVNAYYSDMLISPYYLSFGGSTAASIPLDAGWNLVSLPIVPASTAIADVLSSVAGSYSMVMTYDTLGQSWNWYDPSSTLSTLTSLNHLTAFWILLDHAATLEVSGTPPGATNQQLYTGWNLIAYPSGQARSVTDALTSISGLYTMVYSYEAGAADPWRRYGPNVPAYFNSLAECTSGRGYWVEVDQDCTFSLVN